MKLRLLSPGGGTEFLQYLTSYILNESVAIDAGSLGLSGTPLEQAKIDHVFITHSHLDHVGGLPIFLDTVLDLGGETVSVHASEWVLDCLKRDIFNDRLMPDFFRISEQGPVFLKFHPQIIGQSITVAGLRITPIAANHVVPTVAYVADDGKVAVAIATDTAPCENLLSDLKKIPHLRALLLDCSFPRSQKELAKISGHMTTDDFAAVARQLEPGVEVWAIHIKPRFHAEVIAELKELLGDCARVLAPGQDYFWVE